jgi:hypothetical protein
MDNLRNDITTKILGKIPARIKPIDYLVETLNISRESVYRRIRGDISFTLEEIVKLSIELGFSIDELARKNQNTRAFFDIQISSDQNPSEIFISMFRQYFHHSFELTQAKSIESIMALNHIPLEFIVFFDNLFKFSYYRWMHQSIEFSLNYCYSNVVLPQELISMQQKVIENSKKIRSNTFIFDPNIFKNFISEIQYYHKRKLISNDEFLQCKEELFNMIDLMESIAQTGFYTSNAKFNFYLSSINIESNNRYTKYDDQVQSQFFIHSMESLIIDNSNICALHKKRLDSLRKYATFITQSNEILQVKYFNKQRSYIDKIEEHHLIGSV